MKSKKVIIIGGGIGGIAAAALLGREGYSVTVIEKNPEVGGRASIWKSKGFTFDMGPSWYLMPDVFENFFKKFNKKSSDLLDLKRLDPHYRVFFGKNDYIDIHKEMEKNNILFEDLEKGSSAKIKKYLDKAKSDYNLAMQYILYKEFRSLKDFFTADIIREGRKLNPFKNFDQYVKKIVYTKKLQQILMYPIVFLGGSPKKTPSFYSILSHVDFNLGVFYPQGGIFKLIKALKFLAKENHVTILTNKSVSKVIVVDGIAKGVKVNKKNYFADIIVSNADYAYTENSLLEEKYQTYTKTYWESRTIAPSAFILYLGINKKIPSLKHHTLSFAHDWEKHFEEIFTKPAYPKSPSFYICAPSKTDPSVAPKGCENIFILVPISPFIKDSESKRKDYANVIIQQVEKLIGENIHDHIIVQRVFSIKDFISRYNAYKGTALGLAHTLKQTAFLRPAMKSKKVKNLYYVGQYTQPGIGMPMCLISAELVSNRINEEHKEYI